MHHYLLLPRAPNARGPSYFKIQELASYSRESKIRDFPENIFRYKNSTYFSLFILSHKIHQHSDVTLTPHDGRWHWILNHLQATKITEKIGCLQLIQKSAPSTIVWWQCDIWITSPGGKCSATRECPSFFKSMITRESEVKDFLGYSRETL